MPPDLNNLWFGLLILFSATISSAVTLEIIKRMNIGRAFHAEPTDRSNHSTPVPQLGGLVICPIAILIGYLCIDPHELQFMSIWIMWLGFLLAFLVGVFDDAMGLGYRSKLAVQLFSACMVVLSIMDTSRSDMTILHSIPFGLTVLVVAYWMNMANFMDGIDLMEISCLGLPLFFLSFWLLISGHQSNPIVIVGLASAGALFGFGIHNRPPASMFLGDSGSLYCGIVSAAIVLIAVRHISFTSSILPFLFMIADTTSTLVLRLARRRNIFAAHSEHAYQIALRNGKAAYQIALTVTGVTVVLCGLSVVANFSNTSWLELVCLMLGVAISIGLLIILRSPSKTRTTEF